MKKEVANPSKPKINIINLIFIFFTKLFTKRQKYAIIYIESEEKYYDNFYI